MSELPATSTSVVSLICSSMPGAVAMIVPAMRVRGQVALLWLRVHTVLSPRVPAYRCPDLEGCGLWLRRWHR
jgi:hypothetical protein